MLRPLAVPFTTTGIVVIFLIFFLFQREDLRNRFIRLAGSDDLERTTAALDDAGQLAEADAALGRLDDTRLENIHQTVSEIIEDLGSHERAPDEKAAKQGSNSPKGNVVDIDARKLGRCVFCIPGLGRLDDCAALLVADFLKRRGVTARTSAAAAAIEADTADTICICFLEKVTGARVDFTVRKLSRQAPSATVIVCLLGEEHDALHEYEAGSNIAPRSLEDVLAAVEKNTTRLCRKEQ